MGKKVQLKKLLLHLHGHRMFILHENLLAAKVTTASELEHQELLDILIHHKLIHKMDYQ